MQSVLTLTMILGMALQTAFTDTECPPDGYSLDELLVLKQRGFELEAADSRNRLAIGLAGCTGHADPEIRDGVAFSGLSAWLRGNQLSSDTVQVLSKQLLAQLEGPPDAHGFRQPFAALILSEVVRTDRISPVFSDEQRQQLVDSTSNYLASVKDYRGFSDQDGWRHGVAHGADLALQLVLNSAIDAAQTIQLLNAIGRQVAPEQEVFYVYGEPARLARPVFYAFQRDLLEQDWWAQWLERVTDPSPLENWGKAWSSNSGLAKRHNTMSFLLALHFNAVNSDSDASREFATMILEAMKQL